MPTKSLLHNPATILAGLGLVSGTLGSYDLGANYGEAPAVGIYMVFAGIWFGLVIGYGIWRWAGRSLPAAALAGAGTWVAWEVAINIGLHIDQRWLADGVVAEPARGFITGMVAGGIGALLTWAAAAAVAPALRHAASVGLVVATGALFGLLLPSTSHYDYPAILLLPWQAGVAAALGISLAAGWRRVDAPVLRSGLS
jgi:hypothetical protein